MRKLLITLCMLLSGLSVNADNVFAKYNFRTVSFGVGGGAYKLPEMNYQEGFYALYLGIYGVHFDIDVAFPKKGACMDVGKWDDERFLSFHFGYQIPICSWFKITPLVGPYWYQTGITDGYRYRFTNYGVSNKFNVKTSNSGFDYGINALFDIPLYTENHHRYYNGFDGMKFQIGGTLTKTLWSAQIGLEILF